MKRRPRAGSTTSNAQRGKRPTPKRSRPLKAVSRRRSTATGRVTEMARLVRERDEALEREKATAEVLRVISLSPGALEPVFEAVLENATRICEAKFGNLWLRDGNNFRIAATHGAPRAYREYLQGEPVVVPDAGTTMGRVVNMREVVQIDDIRTAPESSMRIATVKLANARSLVAVPMIKGNEVIGVIAIYRQEVRRFTDKQVALLANFAAQAVIAVENTRLLNELRQRTNDLSESLEQQTATSEVLRVISSSPGDLQPVFQVMLQNAARICEARAGNIYRWEDSALRLVTTHNTPPAFAEFLRRTPVHATANNPVGRMQKTKSLVHTADLSTQQSYIGKSDAAIVAAVDLGGVRTQLSVPLLKDNDFIGAITLWRDEIRPFDDRQIALVQNFAAQAVIAIENTRLLHELRQRTNDLTESLEQQTATSEVLSVISSSPGDLQPVFQVILENATRLCEAKFATLFRYDGEMFFPAAGIGRPAALVEAHSKRGAFKAVPGTTLYEVWRTKSAVHTEDDATAPDPGAHVRFGGARSTIGFPMLKDNTLIGVIVIYRQEVRTFTQKQIELVTNFAAQAVIAIENARLLNELRQSLEQQTATADVLRVISSSPGELEPVFLSMLANAVRICDAKFGTLYRYDNKTFEAVANFGVPPAYAEFQRQRSSFQPPAGTALDCISQTKELVSIADVATAGDASAGPAAGAAAKFGGARSLVGVPMLKDDVLIGAIAIYRQEVRPFTDKQIALVQNFAAQAVIAIENARLLSELRQSLEQQTATAEVLSVINSSPGDLNPVFEAMLEKAVQLCGAEFGNIYRWSGDALHLLATHNTPPAFAEARRNLPFRPGPATPTGRMVATKTVTHVADLAAEPRATEQDDREVRFGVDVGGIRTLLSVPMLKENELVGAFTIYRQEVRPFSDKQIALVQNFAAQAVIAIENTRLLNELRESLDRQTATADILRVIASTPEDSKRALDTIAETSGADVRRRECPFQANRGRCPSCRRYGRSHRGQAPGGPA